MILVLSRYRGHSLRKQFRHNRNLSHIVPSRKENYLNYSCRDGHQHFESTLEYMMECKSQFKESGPGIERLFGFFVDAGTEYYSVSLVI